MATANATVRKIGENVFMISWTAMIPSYNTRRPTYDETIVYIDEISQSCRLVCKTEDSRYRTSVLEIEINPFASPARDKKSKVFNTASVSVMKDGVDQLMEFHDLKWTGSFSGTCSCRHRTYCSSANFLILIEFISTSIKSETKHVMDHLFNLWETKTLADVTFKFREKQIKAHTLIIASGSPVLAAMFQNDFRERQERIVTIKDTNPAVFEKMLRFFYTGDADLDIADAIDLLIVADKFGVDSLKEECAFRLAQNLTMDRVIRCLIVSYLHDSPYLYKSALEFTSLNSESIVTKKDWVDLMKNYHELSLEVVKAMVLTKNKFPPY